MMKMPSAQTSLVAIPAIVAADSLVTVINASLPISHQMDTIAKRTMREKITMIIMAHKMANIDLKISKMEAEKRMTTAMIIDTKQFQRHYRLQMFLHWLPIIGCAISAHSMRTAIVVFARVDRASVVMELFARVFVPKVMFGQWTGASRLTQMSMMKVTNIFVLNPDKFIKYFMVSEEEIAPFCHLQGCSCADGYQLIEYAIKQICRKIHQSDGSNHPEGEDEKCKCMHITS